MNDLINMKQEKSVLRWGGLAGLLGCIFLILSCFGNFTMVDEIAVTIRVSE